MFGIGFTELVLILIAALIFIGPRRMPEIAKAAGKAFMEFRKAAEGLKDQVTDFGAVDDSGDVYRQASYGADVPEGHAPPPPPDEHGGESAGKPSEESPEKDEGAGPEGRAEEPGPERAESTAPKKAAPAGKKTRARKSAPKSAPSGSGKKSSKSASAGGAKKGKGKGARTRAGRDDGGDTPA